MAVRSTSWLLTSLAVLGVVAAAEVHYRVGVGSGGAAGDTSARPDAVSPAPLFAMAERESFTETLDRPLFNPNRQPAGVAEPDPTPTTRAARPKANRYALSAIIIVDDERIALLTDTATGNISRVREGEDLAGWNVEAIHDDGAVLSNGDTREELSLRSFGPPQPPTARSRPRAGADRDAIRDDDALPERPRRPRRGPRQAPTLPGSSAN